MATRNGKARWEGSLKRGEGTISFGEHELPYSFESRFEDGEGTNPEELIGAAHAGCFSMALANELAEAGFEPKSVATTAKVHLNQAGDDITINKIELHCDANVPEISPEEFKEFAIGAKANCPVSKALGGVDDIVLEWNLTSS